MIIFNGFQIYCSQNWNFMEKVDKYHNLIKIKLKKINKFFKLEIKQNLIK